MISSDEPHQNGHDPAPMSLGKHADRRTHSCGVTSPRRIRRDRRHGYCAAFIRVGTPAEQQRAPQTRPLEHLRSDYPLVLAAELVTVEVRLAGGQALSTSVGDDVQRGEQGGAMTSSLWLLGLAAVVAAALLCLTPPSCSGPRSDPCPLIRGKAPGGAVVIVRQLAAAEHVAEKRHNCQAAREDGRGDNGGW